jgi:hypothetical protein
LSTTTAKTKAATSNTPATHFSHRFLRQNDVPASANPDLPLATILAERGDLLVSSSTLGYAMKGTDRSRMLGAVVGKALGSLDSGTGVIEVLVTLQ